MNNRIVSIGKGAFIGALLTLTSVNAQEVFPLRARWQIENETYAWGLLREDGIKDLVYYTEAERIGNYLYQEVAIRTALGEITFSQRYQGVALPIVTFDFTGDGNDDIVATLGFVPDGSPVKIFDGRNLFRTIEFWDPFEGNGMLFDGKLVNNDERVLIRKVDFWAHHNEDRMTDVTRSAAYLMFADPNTFELDTVAYSPDDGTFYIKDYQNGDFDYYVFGEIDTTWLLPVETDTVYTTLLTSYGADIRNPRQLIIAQENEDRQNRLNRSEWIIPPYSIVDDIDHDGTLDWVVGHYDESEVDTYTVYITKYNPANFEIQAEYSERLPGWGEWAQGTAFIRGIHAVDVNADGTGEILLAIPEHPLRILDPVNLTLIMVSDSSLDAPRTVNPKKTEIGFFEENHYHLQLAHFISGRFVKVYDLPGGWYYPQSIEGEKAHHPTLLSLTAFPNPFNSSTTITFSTGRDARPTRLELFDPLGRRIDDLIPSQQLAPGSHRFVLRAGDLPAGVYLIRLDAKDETINMKVTLVK